MKKYFNLRKVCSLVLVSILSLVNISVYSFTVHLCHILKIKLIYYLKLLEGC